MAKRELEYAETPDQGAAKAARPDGQPGDEEEEVISGEEVEDQETPELTDTVARGGLLSRNHSGSCCSSGLPLPNARRPGGAEAAGGRGAAGGEPRGA